MKLLSYLMAKVRTILSNKLSFQANKLIQLFAEFLSLIFKVYLI